MCNTNMIDFFSHPDYNCRYWNLTRSTTISMQLADFTAGRELHPAPKIGIEYLFVRNNYTFTLTFWQVNYYFLMKSITMLPSMLKYLRIAYQLSLQSPWMILYLQQNLNVLQIQMHHSQQKPHL